jgi:histidine phosphotransferase ChpT
MQVSTDLRTTELLASRLCHDLVGPVSAVRNGLELMSEVAAGLDDEAARLVSDSADQTAVILQFYRLAYGASGQIADFRVARSLSDPYLAQRKTGVELPEEPPESSPEGFPKLLLNMLALAVDALPRGGRLAVTYVDGAEGFEVSVAALGTEVGLHPEVQAALAPGISTAELTPRNVHAYFTRLVVERLDGRLRVLAESDQRLLVAALLPG